MIWPTSRIPTDPPKTVPKRSKPSPLINWGEGLVCHRLLQHGRFARNENPFVYIDVYIYILHTTFHTLYAHVNYRWCMMMQMQCRRKTRWTSIDIDMKEEKHVYLEIFAKIARAYFWLFNDIHRFQCAEYSKDMSSLSPSCALPRYLGQSWPPRSRTTKEALLWSSLADFDSKGKHETPSRALRSLRVV